MPEKFGHLVMELRAEELRLKRLAREVDVGKNRANAIADLDVEFPWSRALRDVSPTNTLHSYLMPFWYRAGQRWVLYDVLPIEAIADELDTGSGISGAELKAVMAGPRPSERTDDVPVSDLQHEMFRRWRGYARPFWVLQGETGGHQVRFSPQQSSALLRMGLPSEPPPIGSLAPCPFDNRSAQQLRHLNRLHQYEDSIERLRRSGSPEAAKAEQDRIEREIREAEMAFVEAQVRPLVEMSLSHGIAGRSENQDELIHVPHGTAARAADAYQRYQETGDWTLPD
jgi:hypothetical protein